MAFAQGSNAAGQFHPDFKQNLHISDWIAAPERITAAAVGDSTAIFLSGGLVALNPLTLMTSCFACDRRWICVSIRDEPYRPAKERRANRQRPGPSPFTLLCHRPFSSLSRRIVLCD